MRKSSLATWRLVCLGALSFWIPDALVHLLRGNSFDSHDIRIITFVLPLILFIACVAGAKLVHMTIGATAIRMLGGIWLFGGFLMTVSFTFSGGGIANLGVLGSILLIAFSWVPIYTGMAATYDGSLFALLLASAGLFLVWILPSSGLALSLTKRMHRNDS